MNVRRTPLDYKHWKLNWKTRLGALLFVWTTRLIFGIRLKPEWIQLHTHNDCKLIGISAGGINRDYKLKA